MRKKIHKPRFGALDLIRYIGPGLISNRWIY